MTADKAGGRFGFAGLGQIWVDQVKLEFECGDREQTFVSQSFTN